MNLQESHENKALAKQSRDLAEQSRLIGQYTAELARQTTRDSSSMITIAAVTMFFLPATFVSVRKVSNARLKAADRQSLFSVWGSFNLTTAKSVSRMTSGYILLRWCH